MMEKQVKLKIYGQVQGVFFRMHTQRKAQRLGLGGWVKNEKDGSVTAIAVGEEDKLKEFINWAHHGSEFAQVDDIKIEWSEPKENFTNFEIKY
ncbi:acylphosphatase [Patescibacteria group bacterium AH-259-L07]|nr:acylphosphatase [Patescibacteria group bacterium AH-259-L07]